MIVTALELQLVIVMHFLERKNQLVIFKNTLQKIVVPKLVGYDTSTTEISKTTYLVSITLLPLACHYRLFSDDLASFKTLVIDLTQYLCIKYYI